MNVTPASIRSLDAPAASRPAAPPEPGTEPTAAAPSRMRSLWDLLTPDEREFFSQQESLGPLTYARGRAAGETPAAPVGRRIDVKG